MIACVYACSFTLIYVCAARKEIMKHIRSDRKSSGRTGAQHFNWYAIPFCAFAALAVWLLLTEIWAFTNWSNLQMEEIIFELTQPLTGTGNNILGKYFMKCLVPAVIVLILILAYVVIYRGSVHVRKVSRIGMFLSLALFAVSFLYGWITLGIGDYLLNLGRDSTYIEDNYADPAKVNITFPDKKRNLIYIFLESMEITDADKADGGGFDENYIPELTALAQENEDFSGDSTQLNGGRAMNGATWTVGAMFAQTSGLPLKTQLDTNGMSSQSSFFPGITTLGDILHQNGYQQTLMIGSNATFGGRRLYFTEHGSYDIRDYLYAKQMGEIPQDYQVWWGYEDEKLFQFAKTRLNQLGSSGEPFNFTMLTADTHFPDGYLCPLCDTTEFDGNQYAEVYHCSSRQVTEFVAWCQQQPWYENTTIVISGDHPTMDADFCDPVDKDYQRRVYTCYINAAAENEAPHETRDYTTFDDFPTTLAALGCTIEGNRLGLGTNLFSGEQTLTERDGYEEMNVELTRNSEFMRKASGISDETIRVRKAIQKLKPKVSLRMLDSGYLYITVKGLEDLDQYSSVVKYVYLHIRNSNQLTIYEPQLVRETDGTYAVSFTLDHLKGYSDITWMVRVSTTMGTIDLTDAEPYTVKSAD